MISRLSTLLLLSIALLLLGDSIACAQRLSTKGKDFWLGFMETAALSGSIELRVYITSDVATSGTVSVPLAGWSQPFNVAANSSAMILVPVNLAHTKGSDSIQGNGVHVVADDSVSVFALNYVKGTADATVVLPVPSLGDDHLVMAYHPLSDINTGEVFYPSEFLVASVDDGTIVEITPVAGTKGGHPAGVPFSVTLNAGQVYQVQADTDLTGSRVRRLGGNRGCLGIAVFGGAELTTVGGCISGDHLYNQIYPITTWGTEYLTVPLKATKRLGTMVTSFDRINIFRILASQNGTTVTIDGGAPITLNAGKFYEVLLDSAHYIRSDKPVSIAQYSRGNLCDFTDSTDPFMMILSPIQQSLRTITFNAFTSPNLGSYYLNLVTPTSGTALATLDGVSIAFAFKPVPGNPLYSFAQLRISQGNHTLRSDSGLIAYVYGYGKVEAYGYSAGASVENIAPPLIEQICGCSGVQLSAPPGFASYLWSTGDTTRSIDVTTSGDYSVKLKLIGGCDPFLQPPKVTITGFTPADISLSPSTMEAVPGEVVPLRLSITPPHYALECTRDSATATLRFNRSLLAPNYIEGGSIVRDTIIGHDRLLSIRSHSDSSVYLELIAALGDSESTPIVMESIAWGDCTPPKIEEHLAEFHLNGICREGGTRLFESNDSVYLKPARPDPASTRAEIEYGVIENGWTELFIVNNVGQRVMTLVAADLQPGRYVVPLDATSLPAGVYSYVLRTPSQSMERRVRVVK